MTKTQTNIETKLKEWAKSIINNKDYTASKEITKYQDLLEKYTDKYGDNCDDNILWWADEAISVCFNMHMEALALGRTETTEKYQVAIYCEKTDKELCVELYNTVSVAQQRVMDCYLDTDGEPPTTYAKIKVVYC